MAKKLNASRAMEIKKESSLALELALSQVQAAAPDPRLFFLQDALMMVLKLPAFPYTWYFVWEGTLGTA